jgi:hypothetical protein
MRNSDEEIPEEKRHDRKAHHGARLDLQTRVDEVASEVDDQKSHARRRASGSRPLR